MTLKKNYSLYVLTSFYIFLIFISFDNELEVRSVFLYMSKAFDKVWHEGLIFTLKQNGISGELLQVISDF